jgi:hypothetical protein
VASVAPSGHALGLPRPLTVFAPPLPRASSPVQVLGAEQDELDGPTFDAVEFINKKFHDERSLDGLDDAIAKFDAEIKE